MATSAVFGMYRNPNDVPVCVKLPAKDVVSMPPGISVALADVWPGVQAAVKSGLIVRGGDAPKDKVLLVPVA